MSGGRVKLSFLLNSSFFKCRKEVKSTVPLTRNSFIPLHLELVGFLRLLIHTDKRLSGSYSTVSQVKYQKQQRSYEWGDRFQEYHSQRQYSFLIFYLAHPVIIEKGSIP